MLSFDIDHKAEKIMLGMVTHGLAIMAGMFVAPFFLGLGFLMFAAGASIWYFNSRLRVHRRRREKEISDRLVRLALAEMAEMHTDAIRAEGMVFTNNTLKRGN